MRCLGKWALSNSSTSWWTLVLQDLITKPWARSRVRHHLPLVSVSPEMNSLCGLVPKAKSLAICLDLIFLLFLPQLLLLEVTYRYLGIVARFPSGITSPSFLQSLLIRYLNHFPCQLLQRSFFIALVNTYRLYIYISSPNFKGWRSLLRTEEVERRAAWFRFPRDPAMAKFPANWDKIGSCIRMQKWMVCSPGPVLPPRSQISSSVQQSILSQSTKPSGYPEIWVYFLSFLYKFEHSGGNFVTH